MKTLRAKAGFYGVDSVRGVAERMGLAKGPTISLREILSSADVHTFTADRQLRAGDVATDEMVLTVQRDGAWSFDGRVFDHGTAWGDDFTVSAAVMITASEAVVASYSGNVGAQTHSQWTGSAIGFDARIRDSWDAVIQHGCSFHLTQSSSIDISDVISTIERTLVAIGTGIVIVQLALYGGHVEATPDGGARVVPNVPRDPSAPPDH